MIGIVNKLVVNFVWNGKILRIKSDILIGLKEKRGFRFIRI